jgi:hypothetical protein
MKRIFTSLLFAGMLRAADVTLWTSGQFILDNPVRYTAMEQVRKIFARAGVTLEWATRMPVASDELAIEIRYETGVTGHSGAIAFSTPFDPQPVITVLCDRILSLTETQREIRATLLAHTLAHEIGHVLMGTNGHSPDGMMKAHWTASDYGRMANRPLPFLPDEADFMRRALASRAVRAQRVP